MTHQRPSSILLLPLVLERHGQPMKNHKNRVRLRQHLNTNNNYDFGRTSGGRGEGGTVLPKSDLLPPSSSSSSSSSSSRPSCHSQHDAYFSIFSSHHPPHLLILLISFGCVPLYPWEGDDDEEKDTAEGMSEEEEDGLDKMSATPMVMMLMMGRARRTYRR